MIDDKYRDKIEGKKSTVMSPNNLISTVIASSSSNFFLPYVLVSRVCCSVCCSVCCGVLWWVVVGCGVL
jgi:hypothetical protein